MFKVSFAAVKSVLRANSDKWLMIDCVLYNLKANVSLGIRDVRELTRKLSSVNSFTFEIL